jgi:hypothetical protein
MKYNVAPGQCTHLALVHAQLADVSFQEENVSALHAPAYGDQLWLCGLIPHSALVGVREYDGKAKKRLQYK